jgi:hypothetical protein
VWEVGSVRSLSLSRRSVCQHSIDALEPQSSSCHSASVIYLSIMFLVPGFSCVIGPPLLGNRRGPFFPSRPWVRLPSPFQRMTRGNGSTGGSSADTHEPSLDLSAACSCILWPMYCFLGFMMAETAHSRSRIFKFTPTAEKKERKKERKEHGRDQKAYMSNCATAYLFR